MKTGGIKSNTAYIECAILWKVHPFIAMERGALAVVSNAPRAGPPAGTGCRTNVSHASTTRAARARMGGARCVSCRRRQGARSSPREIDGMGSAAVPGWGIPAPGTGSFRRNEAPAVQPLDPSSARAGATCER